MAGLRERRHQETRRAVVDAAFELFADRGFAEVTMDEIARAAGVSRSTAYRRFPTKEDVVLEVPRRWLGVFDDAYDALPETTNLGDAMRATSLAVARHIDGDGAAVLAAYTVMEQAPSLRTSGIANQAWLDRIAAMVERFSDAGVERAGFIAGAYLGAIDAMMQTWTCQGGATSVAAATERLLDCLEPILP